jgi:chromatin remodeling complex protein RSC6
MVRASKSVEKVSTPVKEVVVDEVEVVKEVAKKSRKTKVQEPVPEVVLTNEVVSETKPVKESKKAKKVKESPEVKESLEVKEPTEELLKESTEVKESTESVKPVVELPSLSSKLVEFGLKLQQSALLHSTIKSEYKVLEKMFAKHEKLALKKSHKKRKSSGKSPVGFITPLSITDETSEFLGVEKGTKLTRREVTNAIHAYIKERNLQMPENRRNIIPDEKLRTLLKIDSTDPFHYFNLQTFLKHLFIKEPVVESVAV